VPIDATIETKIDMSYKHESQFFEWLPYNRGRWILFPRTLRAAGKASRLLQECGGKAAEKFAAQLAALPGSERIQYVEAFQISEYGRRPIYEELQALFPIR